MLKWLEKPSLYHIAKDDLYELDDDSFDFMKNCCSTKGCPGEDSEFINYCFREGILTRNEILLKRPPIIKSPFPSLRYLELQITNLCNLKCRHCYVEDDKISELSVSQIRMILKEFEELQGLRVLITGGEPLMHHEFRELNKIFPEFFVRKVLFTNGILLNKKLLRGLNVNEIQVSVDGLEAAHDSLRGKGTFKKAIEAVVNSIDAGFDVAVSTMVHTGNLGDFKEMEEFFKNIGVKCWVVDVPCVTGRLKKNASFHLSPEIAGEYFKYGYGGGFHSGTTGYACGIHLMGIMSSGMVSKCTFYADHPIGKIEEGLRECWQRIRPVKLADLKCDCDVSEECRGGCRYRALLLGDSEGKDLYKCYYYGKI
ncbi:MAG: radical SAM protein [Nitrospirota bacterium]